MKSFDIIHHDGLIRARIDDQGHATIRVNLINDQGIVIKAINRAFQEGAISGTLFTGEVVNDNSAGKHLVRSEKGRTWLGGKVTRLDDGPDGPTFRVDWTDFFPQITE
jgi:hypothetical protein